MGKKGPQFETFSPNVELERLESTANRRAAGTLPSGSLLFSQYLNAALAQPTDTFRACVRVLER